MPIYPKPVKRVGFKAIRQINMRVTVSRIETRDNRWNPDRTFVACAQLKTGGWTRVRTGYELAKLHDACGYGRNPRIAIARALGAAKRKIEARRGAFRGTR